MRKIIVGFMSMAALATILTITSCQDEDLCKGVTCQNGGTCADGDCNCVAGYEGTNCETVSRAKIIASYSVAETCSITGAANYSVAITTSGTDIAKVLITPFAGYPGLTATATIDGNSLTIPSQTVSGYTFSGTGTVNNAGASITMNYTITAGGQTESCPGTWTKQ
jgi:hypothetical protein